MPFKMVITLNSAGNGWTETYYSGLANLTAIDNAFTPLFYSRCASWRSALTSVEEVSFRDVDNLRAAVNYSPFGSVVPPHVVSSPDVVSTDALFRLRSENPFKTRSVWLRGLRDEDVVRDALGNSVPSANITSNANSWFNYLKATWQICIRYVAPPTGANAPRTVLTVKPNALNIQQSDIITQQAHGFVAGDRVFFGQLPQHQLAALRGYFTVVAAPDAFTFTVRYAVPNAGAGTIVFPTTGYVRKAVFAYNAVITSQFFRYFGTHKTGRRSAVSRGRSRPVVRRQ
jgi:hypothetical protein